MIMFAGTGQNIDHLDVLPTFPERATYFFENSYRLESFPTFAFYLTCIALIPLWKKVLPQLELKMVMIIYNIICVILSIAATGLCAYGAVIPGEIYAFKENWYTKTGLLVYTFSKNFELLDTLFMILRQRWRQISFLHVFHHSSILILGNYAYVHAPYPPIALVLALNSLVHIFLYAYYAQTAIWKTQRPTWKKRLTQLQIWQFVFDVILSGYGYLHHGFCIYSVFYGLSMMILFGNFYYVAYVKRRPDTMKKTE